jgi:hypothetical protein
MLINFSISRFQWTAATVPGALLLSCQFNVNGLGFTLGKLEFCRGIAD